MRLVRHANAIRQLGDHQPVHGSRDRADERRLLPAQQRRTGGRDGVLRVLGHYRGDRRHSHRRTRCRDAQLQPVRTTVAGDAVFAPNGDDSRTSRSRSARTPAGRRSLRRSASLTPRRGARPTGTSATSPRRLGFERLALRHDGQRSEQLGGHRQPRHLRGHPGRCEPPRNGIHRDGVAGRYAGPDEHGRASHADGGPSSHAAEPGPRAAPRNRSFGAVGRPLAGRGDKSGAREAGQDPWRTRCPACRSRAAS